MTTPAAPPRKHVKVPLKLWQGGRRLLTDTTKLNHVAFCGVGWGKTHLGSNWCIPRIHANLESSSRKGAILAPNLRLLKRHMFPSLKAALERFNIREGKHYRFHKQDYVIEFGKKFKNYQVFLVSMENFQAMVAWEFDWLWWDEPGFGSEDLRDFVDQRVGRAPGSAKGQVLYTGVIQLANWYYERFGLGSSLRETSTYRLPEWISTYAPGWGGKEFVRFRENEHSLVLHAASYENERLNPDYFIRLWEAFGWKETKFRAHVLGEAIALNTNAVYDAFNEAVNVGDFRPNFKGETPHLNVCFDFNVGRMSCLVVQSYEEGHYVVWENSDECKTTRDACHEFMRAFPPERYGGHLIRIFGDSGGWARSAQLRTRDGNYSIIRDTLQPHYPRLRIEAPKHVVIHETRVQSTNEFLARSRKGGGGKGLWADRKCRKLISGWRNSVWDPKTGKIKKSGAEDDLTHAPEAIDYFMYVEEPPINRPMTGSTATANVPPARR